MDLAADPRFADLRDLDGTALAACRASPIFGGTGQVIGVLTLYFDRPRDADPGEIAVAQSCLRSEEHTSELQSLMRISYAVFCLKKKNQISNDSTPSIIVT